MTVEHELVFYWDLGRRLCITSYFIDAGLSTGWEQIELALDERKSQLQNSEVASTPKKQSHNSTTPWSYRALRRSALGPTLALLRNNGNDAGPVGEHASAEDPNTK